LLRLISKNFLALLASILVFLYAFFISLYLLSAYVAGDQYHYRIFYEALGNSEVKDLLTLLRRYLSAGEPMSGLVLWIGANLGINKDIYIALLNSLLFLGMFAFCVKQRVNAFFFILLSFNFYVFVLFTGAERLKIAFLFLIYAAYSKGWVSKVLLVLSVFSHFQTAIILVGTMFNRARSVVLDSLTRLKINKKDFVFIILLIIIFFGLLINFGSIIIGKIEGYSKLSGGLLELTQLFLLSLVSVVVLKSKAEFFSYLLPIVFASIVVGSSRFNILAFFILLFFVAKQDKTSHPLILILMFYFSFKSFDFLNNILSYGDGFYIK